MTLELSRERRGEPGPFLIPTGDFLGSSFKLAARIDVLGVRGGTILKYWTGGRTRLGFLSADFVGETLMATRIGTKKQKSRKEHTIKDGQGWSF